MAHILLFPSVLGVRRGITDLAEMLTGVGHSVTTVDILDGETFDDYETAGARSQEVGLPRADGHGPRADGGGTSLRRHRLLGRRRHGPVGRVAAAGRCPWRRDDR